MSTDCALSIMALAFKRVYDRRFDRKLVDISLLHHKGSIIPHARRNLVERSIEAGATHIFFIDSDVVLPVDALDRLIAHHQPIVLASYTRRYEDGHKLIGLVLTDGPEHAVLTPMATAPLGCALIKLSVFTNLPRPWFSYRFGGEAVEGAPSPLTYFADMSEDVSFCNAARLAGYTVWMDPKLTREIGHAGTTIHRYKDPT